MAGEQVKRNKGLPMNRRSAGFSSLSLCEAGGELGREGAI